MSQPREASSSIFFYVDTAVGITHEGEKLARATDIFFFHVMYPRFSDYLADFYVRGAGGWLHRVQWEDYGGTCYRGVQDAVKC